MPHIQVELDAIKDALRAAPLVGIPGAQMIGGLTITWAYCWEKKTDQLVELEIVAMFSCPDHLRAKLIEALVVFQFIDPNDDGVTFRLRGADKYLRIAEVLAEAGRRGGLASAAKRKAERLGGLAKPFKGLPGLKPPLEPPLKPPLEPPQALFTDHRSPITEQDLFAGEPAKAADPPVRKERKLSPQQQFLGWCQEQRAKSTQALDDVPTDAVVINSTLKPILSELGAERARGAYLHFLNDGYARDQRPPFPWGLFVAQWKRHAPPIALDAGAAEEPRRVVGPNDDPYREPTLQPKPRT